MRPRMLMADDHVAALKSHDSLLEFQSESAWEATFVKILHLSTRFHMTLKGFDRSNSST